MPYGSISELPAPVKKRYSSKCQRAFMHAFNGHQGDESSRFAVGHSAARRCQEANKAMSNAVKFVAGSDNEIEGLAAPFGGPFNGKDFHGEAFDEETDFALDWFPQGRPLLYQHGLDGALKATVQGRQFAAELIDEGLWAKAQLDASAKYHERVKELIEKGKLFFSSGSVPHLVETINGKIKRWPFVELSLTPSPANPNAQVYAVKAVDAIAHLEEVTDVPPVVKAALEALDSWTPDHDSGPESYDDHLKRVAEEVSGLIERTEKRVDLRSAKVGRELSTSNRELLRALDQRLEEIERFRRSIRDVLSRNDPETRKALEQLEVELAVDEVRRSGLPV